MSWEGAVDLTGRTLLLFLFLTTFLTAVAVTAQLPVGGKPGTQSVHLLPPASSGQQSAGR